VVEGLFIVQIVKYKKRMSVKDVVDLKNRFGVFSFFVQPLFVKIAEHTASKRVQLIKKYLQGKKVLDIGLGSGSTSALLTIEGYKTQGIDVVNASLYPKLQPIIYNGKDLPFSDKMFDTGLLICVLHHCGKNQLSVLMEAMRVCKRLIIVEDTFRNKLERFFVAVRDSVGNFEFYHHRYRTVDEWQNQFKTLGWKIVYGQSWSNISVFGMYGRQTIFVIEKKR